MRTVAYAALLLGALDPLEGSWLVAASAGILAIAGRGSLPPATQRRARLAAILVIAGVAGMWILSALGGVGGATGRSPVWLLTLLPYPAGWLLALWGTGRPRWGAPAFMGVGVWYVTLGLLGLRTPTGEPAILLSVAGFGALLLCGGGWLTWQERWGATRSPATVVPRR